MARPVGTGLIQTPRRKLTQAPLLEGETMLAKCWPNLQGFNDRLDREYPQYRATLKLPFPEKLEALADDAMDSE